VPKREDGSPSAGDDAVKALDAPYLPPDRSANKRYQHNEEHFGESDEDAISKRIT
jgi:hypothetical protein